MACGIWSIWSRQGSSTGISTSPAKNLHSSPSSCLIRSPKESLRMVKSEKIILRNKPLKSLSLDVVVKENIFQFLTMLNQKYQTTILLTTHELESIEKFCQRIILLKNGSVGVRIPVIILIVEVLPAPFTPISPTRSPS